MAQLILILMILITGTGLLILSVGGLFGGRVRDLVEVMGAALFAGSFVVASAVAYMI